MTFITTEKRGAVGIITMALNAQSKRVGDLLAGTVVLQERVAAALYQVAQQRDAPGRKRGITQIVGGILHGHRRPPGQGVGSGAPARTPILVGRQLRR